MTPDANALVLLLGRTLLGGVFIWAGIEHFVAFRPLVGIMAQQRIPRPATLLAIGSVWQTVAGLCLILDVGRAWAALALIVFTIVATLMLLAFWRLDHGPAREEQRRAFLTNVALIGGLILAGAPVG